MHDLVVSPAMGVSTLEPGVVWARARIAPPFMEATDASRLVCVVVISFVSRILTHSHTVSDGSSGRRKERKMSTAQNFFTFFFYIFDETYLSQRHQPAPSTTMTDR